MWIEAQNASVYNLNMFQELRRTWVEYSTGDGRWVIQGVTMDKRVFELYCGEEGDDHAPDVDLFWDVLKEKVIASQTPKVL